jgi:hypothetical protein|tara:strand:- start:216 stop:458 length:243 start_codon:yes stop_codon:yes gene_type:complete
MEKATEEDLIIFRKELWDLIEEHAPPEDHKTKRFMVAGQLLATALELYVMSMGKEATLTVMEHALMAVEFDNFVDKSKLH